MLTLFTQAEDKTKVLPKTMSNNKNKLFDLLIKGQGHSDLNLICKTLPCPNQYGMHKEFCPGQIGLMKIKVTYLFT